MPAKDKLSRVHSTFPYRSCCRLARCGWLPSSSGIRGVSLHPHMKDNKKNPFVLFESSNSLRLTRSHTSNLSLNTYSVRCNVVCTVKQERSMKVFFLPSFATLKPEHKLSHMRQTRPLGVSYLPTYHFAFSLRQLLTHLSTLALTHSVTQLRVLTVTSDDLERWLSHEQLLSLLEPPAQQQEMAAWGVDSLRI